jgi:hypothetical protein
MPLRDHFHPPTVPLWLEPNLAVPLELELTYTQVCQSLRIE